VKQLARGKADALPVDFDEAAITGEIIAVSLTLTKSTDQPQVSPRDEASPLIEDLLLWLGIYAGGQMQDTHHRFPSEFAAVVQERQNCTQPRRSAAVLGSSDAEFLQGAVAGTQGRVAENH
jgi:hypothetical protein